MKLLTILLVIISGVVYQVAQRSVPSGANPFKVIAVVYLLGFIACAALAQIAGSPIGLSDVSLLKRLPVWLLVGSCAGCEVGYLLAYRVGWSLGNTACVSYTSTIIVLAVVGAAFYAEGISLRRAAGLALALLGLWLLVKRSVR